MTNSEKDASVICEKWIARLTGEVYIVVLVRIATVTGSEGFLRTQKGKEIRHETTDDRLEDQDGEVTVSNTSNLNGWTV
jgi:hypothetical protein